MGKPSVSCQIIIGGHADGFSHLFVIHSSEVSENDNKKLINENEQVENDNQNMKNESDSEKMITQSNK